jgi:hypothetical protein
MKNNINSKPEIKQPKKLSNRELRKGMKSKGYHIYRISFIAKIMAFILSRQNMEVYWVFAEHFGFMVMNFDDCFRINKAREKNNITKLRVRDMNKMAIFRTPKNAWGIIKKHSK